jgi:hypothetical protein
MGVAAALSRTSGEIMSVFLPDGADTSGLPRRAGRKMLTVTAAV